MKKPSYSFLNFTKLYLLVGEPEIQKLVKSGRKVAEFWTISSVSMVFQKRENRYCTIFKSCKRCLLLG